VLADTRACYYIRPRARRAMSFPGIAAATGTRVDSAAKHTMACKVNEPLMMTWCCDQSNPRSHIHNHKMKYCVHKNDLVLNCGQQLNSHGTIVHPNKAYPAVVSNLGDISAESRRVLQWLYHDSVTAADFITNKNYIRSHIVKEVQTKGTHDGAAVTPESRSKVVGELKNMPYFTAQGYALGTAYASQLSGDTVSSVLIGGMQTVLNGHFECRAGQMIQWYFDFETDCFHRETNQQHGSNTVYSGTRLHNKLSISRFSLSTPAATGKVFTPSETERKRKEFHDREQGALDSFPIGGMGDRKTNIAFPKPYMLRANGDEHYPDRIRIFAKCISGARPHEMLDIMMMTQSL